MSTSPVLVPASLVSQFLANEKMASRHWLQCQMECLLDQVFDQLSTKFEDYLASNAITGTAHHTTIHSNHIQHQLRHEPQHEQPFGAHSHPQFHATNDNLINTKFPVDVGQTQHVSYRGDYHEINSGAQVNPNGIDFEAVMADQTQYPPWLSVLTSNLSLSNKNDANEEYSLDVENDQLHDIDDDAAHVNSCEREVKTEFDDTNNQLITINQVSQSTSSLYAPSSNENLLNQNLIKCKDEEDCDCDDCRIEVKEEGDGDDDDDDVDDSQTIEDNNEEYDLDRGSRNDEQQNGLDYGDIGDDAQIECDEMKAEGELYETNNILSKTGQPQNPFLLSVPLNVNIEQSNQNDDVGIGQLYSIVDGPKQNEHPSDGNHVNERIVHNEERSRPRKKPRLETSGTNNRRVTRQSMRHENRNQTDQVQHINEQNNFDRSQSTEPTEQTEEEEETNEVDNQDKRIIALRVQCHHTGCPLMFNTKTELNAHMRTQHGILLYRCLVKDCKQSFSNPYNLTDHIAQVHSNTTQWHCDKCPKQYSTNRQLAMHNYNYHQIGQYQCAVPNCKFTDIFRVKVFNHYHQHTTIDLICQHSNCRRRFNDTSNFKRHQRAHLGIKPYRCKWPTCGYAATQGTHTIAHIRRMHLKQGSTEALQVDPREYLEVVMI